LADKFVEYDTVYIEGDERDLFAKNVENHYPLPKTGKFIVLVFLGNDLIPFTTVRRWTQEKCDYYYSGINKIFDIECVEEK